MAERDQNTSSRQIKSSDQNLDRLYKLLPADITAAYIGIRTLISTETNNSDSYLLFFGAVILLLTPIYYYRLLQIKDIVQVSFLTFSFAVWAANIDINRIATISSDSPLSGFINFFLNPIFIKGVLVLWAVLLVPLVLNEKKS